MKLIFYGTPEFAVHSLRTLVECGYDVLAVVTAPDKPSGRGLTLNKSSVKKYAESKNLRILQPPNLKDEQFISEINELGPDIQIVVAFRMMPQKLWSLPPLGTFNLHASLLPNYRGAAPINWAIINGEKHTGVTTFFLKHEIDTGDIILQESLPIDENDTAGDLHDKLMILGADLVISTLKVIEKGNVQIHSQETILSDIQLIRSAPKLNNKNCQINWHMDSLKIHDLIRGLSPYPAAFTFLKDGSDKQKKFKITLSKNTKLTTTLSPGSILIEIDKMYVACRDGLIELLEVQLEGKKKMKVSEFVKGFRLQPEMRF